MQIQVLHELGAKRKAATFIHFGLNNNNNNNNTHHDNFGFDSEEYRVILYIDVQRMTHNNDGSDDNVSAAELFLLDEKGSGNIFFFLWDVRAVKSTVSIHVGF